MATIRIATRGSHLALWQAHFVKNAIEERQQGVTVELVIIVSTGDAVRDKPLYELGGVGVFTKEVQEALLDGRADIAVHSLKDLPTQSHPELILAAVPERGPVRDVLLAPKFKTLASLPDGARVATSSLRRRAQLLRHRPDLRMENIRGNVETRIRKLHEQEIDALVLAEAGVHRLGLDHEVTESIEESVMLPAVGQGALGIECRREDAPTQAILDSLNHAETKACVEAERAFLRTLEGGCQLPVGTHTRLKENVLTLRAIVLKPDGSDHREGWATATPASAVALGRDLAQSLLDQGAADLLK